MRRRKFIQLSSLASLPLILKSCDWVSDEAGYPVTVFTDIHTGHLIFESQSFPRKERTKTKTLIVGGGLAGLAAASQLKGQDFLLCELSDRLGGTSAHHQVGGVDFAQGAHYDLAYPANYGADVLNLLKSLEVIEYQPWKDAWSFVDRQYVIPERRSNQCFFNGELREDVLPRDTLYQDFARLLQGFSGEMTMPTRLISEQYHELNHVTFLNFLQDKLALTPEFIRGLDYHMLDDWGGTASQVSALAGIHYFACRPYFNQVVELFSPPEGNAYFIKKLAALHDKELLTGHLVKSIKEQNGHFLAEVVDVNQREVLEIEAERVVYAGQKHALKYIMPEQYVQFESTQYAPWLVVNVLLKNELEEIGYWQNEMIMEDQSFLGFIDSNIQHKEPQQTRVLTAYYCLPPASREDLRNVEANKLVIAEKTLGYINQYFKRDISGLVQEVFIKVMGHAMPIPHPGYLFNDRNQNRIHKNMVFAGVDNGRLPLLFEAVDSGIQAVRSFQSS